MCLSSLAIGRCSVSKSLKSHSWATIIWEEDIISDIGCLNNRPCRLISNTCGVWSLGFCSVLLAFAWTFLPSVEECEGGHPSVLSRPVEQLDLMGHLALNGTSDFSSFLLPDVHPYDNKPKALFYELWLPLKCWVNPAHTDPPFYILDNVSNLFFECHHDVLYEKDNKW